MPSTQHHFRSGIGWVVLACLVFSCSQPVLAKLKGSIPRELVRGDIKAVILASEVGGGREELMIEKSYFGDLKPGRRLSVKEATFQDSARLKLPGPLAKASQKMVLFLVGADRNQIEYNDVPALDNRWRIEPMTSKRILNEKIYVWFVEPSIKDFEKVLTLDESFKDLGDVEDAIEYGLERHEQFLEAQQTQDPRKKLNSLKPFFIPESESPDAEYDLMMWMHQVLLEVESAGPDAAPFLEGLLQMPQFQNDYRRDKKYTGFARMERRWIEESLALTRARQVNDPKERFGILRPLFELRKEDTNIAEGVDLQPALREFVGRSVPELEKLGPSAIPFLKEMLALSAFQEDFGKMMFVDATGKQTSKYSFGLENRKKVQEALDRLERKK